MKKINIIPISDSRLEKKLYWRLFKVLYFIIGLLSGYIYSLLNSYYYSSCKEYNSSIPWEEMKKSCIKFFDYSELFLILIFLLIFLRLLFPVIEKIILYVIYPKK